MTKRKMISPLKDQMIVSASKVVAKTMFTVSSSALGATVFSLPK